MVRRTKEEAMETRFSILDAAEQCFHEKGISSTTLSDVAKAAGVTRGAIYWHFQDKSDLLDALLERMITPLDPLGETTRSADEPDPLGRMQELISQIFQRVEQDPSNRRVHEILFLRCEQSQQNNELYRRLQTMYETHLEHCSLALLNAVSKGQLPKTLDIPSASLTLSGFISGIIYHWLMTPNQLSLAARADALASACIDMLRLSPALLTTQEIPAQ